MQIRNREEATLRREVEKASCGGERLLRADQKPEVSRTAAGVPRELIEETSERGFA